MKTIKQLTNCSFIGVPCTSDISYLIGEVVSDDRFTVGHYIITSPIVSWDADTRLIITRSGSIYKVDVLLPLADLKVYLREKYGYSSIYIEFLSLTGLG